MYSLSPDSQSSHIRPYKPCLEKTIASHRLAKCVLNTLTALPFQYFTAVQRNLRPTPNSVDRIIDLQLGHPPWREVEADTSYQTHNAGTPGSEHIAACTHSYLKHACRKHVMALVNTYRYMNCIVSTVMLFRRQIYISCRVFYLNEIFNKRGHHLFFWVLCWCLLTIKFLKRMRKKY